MRYDTPFKIFSSCQLVRGVKKSLICDLDRKKTYHVPSSVIDFLKKFEGQSVNQVLEHFLDDTRKLVLEYFSFLLEKEIIFFTTTPELFPALDLGWDRPAKISNMLIDSDKHSRHEWPTLANAIDELGVEHLELRFFSQIESGLLENILGRFTFSRVRGISIVAPYEGVEQNQWREFFEMHDRLHRVTLYGAPAHNMKSVANQRGRIFFIEDPLNINSCGQVDLSLMIHNQEFFREAQNYNTCLNRKLSITVDGSIRNCPSLKVNFGDHRQANIMKVVQNPDFQELWSLSKDQIETCQVCEFRYSCQDCRAHLTKPSNLLSKPVHCKYDPYEAVWL